MDEQTFAFGSFSLTPAQRVLLEDGTPLRLGSRELDILVTLVEGAGDERRGPLLPAVGCQMIARERETRRKPRAFESLRRIPLPPLWLVSLEGFIPG